MKRRIAFAAIGCMGFAAAASAQEEDHSIIPAQAPFARQGFYTTHHNDVPPPARTPQTGGGPLPWQQPSGNGLPANVPFQHATPYGSQAIPAPLPMDRAVPVENIEGSEVKEPAAPAVVVPQANPAEENPATPTELTAPLFAADPDTITPREIVLRVLNKVTAHAEELRARPGEIIEFGRLEIEAVSCYNSTPTSQPDSVALLLVRERLPDVKEPKQLFHGWMYASSPSLTSLEHPIYDVTMVDCAMKTKPVDTVEIPKKKKPETPKKPADTGDSAPDTQD